MALLNGTYKLSPAKHICLLPFRLCFCYHLSNNLFLLRSFYLSFHFLIKPPYIPCFLFPSNYIYTILLCKSYMFLYILYYSIFINHKIAFSFNKPLFLIHPTTLLFQHHIYSIHIFSFIFIPYHLYNYPKYFTYF